MSALVTVAVLAGAGSVDPRRASALAALAAA